MRPICEYLFHLLVLFHYILPSRMTKKQILPKYPTKILHSCILSSILGCLQHGGAQIKNNSKIARAKAHEEAHCGTSTLTRGKGTSSPMCLLHLAILEQLLLKRPGSLGSKSAILPYRSGCGPLLW